MLKSLARSTVYGALEVCTGGRGVRRVIGGEPIRFPARWSRYYASGYEPGTFQFLRDRCLPGGTAVDVGAHLGLLSVVMARRVGASGRVFSFEPTESSRAVLARTVRLNGCEGIVEVRPEAVSGATGTATFFDTGTITSNANSLVRTARSRGDSNVPTVSLDEFAASRGIRPHCVKIDAEGVELDVLRGASATFFACRPSVALALHPPLFPDPGATLAEIWALLCDYRMNVRLLQDHTAAGVSGRQLDRDAFCQYRDLFDVELLPAD